MEEAIAAAGGRRGMRDDELSGDSSAPEAGPNFGGANALHNAGKPALEVQKRTRRPTSSRGLSPY